MRCPWWVRWYHRRLRRADRFFIWPHFEPYELEYDPETGGPFSQRLWLEFVAEPGQEHWRCPCADYADQWSEPQ